MRSCSTHTPRSTARRGGTGAAQPRFPESASPASTGASTEPRPAGSGLASRRRMAIASSMGSVHIASPTSSTQARSRAGTRSITSAACAHASTRSTFNSSPPSRTSAAASLIGHQSLARIAATAMRGPTTPPRTRRAAASASSASAQPVGAMNRLALALAWCRWYEKTGGWPAAPQRRIWEPMAQVVR